jgi:hypothetical protein
MSAGRRRRLTLRAWAVIVALAVAMAVISGAATILMAELERTSISIIQVTSDHAQAHILFRVAMGGLHERSAGSWFGERSQGVTDADVRIEAMSEGRWVVLAREPAPRPFNGSLNAETSYAGCIGCAIPAGYRHLLVRIRIDNVVSAAVDLPAVGRPH